jgi:hypothetical protein
MARELTERNVGDCEIREISFTHPDVSLRIFDPFNSSFLTLLFRSVGVMLFETNHVQNVIGSIFLFDSLDEAMTDPLTAPFLTKIAPVELEIEAASKFVHVRPITGGDTIISFKSFEIGD